MSAIFILLLGLAGTTAAIVVPRHLAIRRERVSAAARQAELRRVAQQAADDRLLATADRFGMGAAARQLQYLVPWRGRRSAIDAAEFESNRDLAGTTEAVDRHHAEVTASKLPTSVPLVALMMLFFIVLLALNWRLDAELLAAQGHPWMTAMLLGTVVSVLLELVGLIAFAALNVHRIPLISDLRPNGKVVVVGAVLTLLATGVLIGILPLARGRTELALGTALRSSQATVESLAADGSAIELTTATLALEDVQSRYERSMRNDQLIAGALTVGVVGLSWAPVHGAEVAQLVVWRRRKRRAERRVAALVQERRVFDNDLIGYIAGVLDANGRNPSTLDELFIPQGEQSLGGRADPDEAAPAQSFSGVDDSGFHGVHEPVPIEVAPMPPPPIPPPSMSLPMPSPAPFPSLPPPLTPPPPNPFDLFPGA